MQRAEGLLLLINPHPSPAFPQALALVCKRIPVKRLGSLAAQHGQHQQPQQLRCVYTDFSSSTWEERGRGPCLRS